VLKFPSFSRLNNIPLNGHATLCGKKLLKIIDPYPPHGPLTFCQCSQKNILAFSFLSQVQKQYQKWFTDITKSKSESEAYTLSSKFGPDTKHSEVRKSATYSNVPPLPPYPTHNDTSHFPPIRDKH
jgi:hypothetical protein